MPHGEANSDQPYQNSGALPQDLWAAYDPPVEAETTEETPTHHVAQSAPATQAQQPLPEAAEPAGVHADTPHGYQDETVQLPPVHAQVQPQEANPQASPHEQFPHQENPPQQYAQQYPHEQNPLQQYAQQQYSQQQYSQQQNGQQGYPQQPASPQNYGAQTPLINPGWYPDPSGEADFRMWNGSTWLDDVMLGAYQFHSPLPSPQEVMLPPNEATIWTSPTGVSALSTHRIWISETERTRDITEFPLWAVQRAVARTGINSNQVEITVGFMGYGGRTLWVLRNIPDAPVVAALMHRQAARARRAYYNR